MNQKDVTLSFTGGTNTQQAILYAYLLCDEVFDAIEFSGPPPTPLNTTTGTISSDYILVGSVPFDQFTVNSYGPITLTFNPSALNLSKKINRIVYQFDDGSPSITNSFYYSEPSEATANYPYPNEPGDPRNFKVTKSFYSSSYFSQTYNVYILVYQFGNIDPTGILYQVNVIAPEMDGNNGGYFEEMHLISTRMFGPNDDILYTFETKNPNYIVPVSINWDTVPQNQIEQTNVTSPSPRTYRILQPYEIENIKETQNIKIISLVNSKNTVPDNGQVQTFRLLDSQSGSTLYPYLSGVLTTQDGKYLRIGNYYNNNLNNPNKY
jgi:hypothetical protein